MACRIPRCAETMSASLLSGLVPIIVQARQNLIIDPQLLPLPVPTSLAEQIAAYENYIQDLTVAMSQLGMSLESLQENHNRWLRYVDSDLNQTGAEMEYAAMTNNEEGVLSWIERVRTRIAVLAGKRECARVTIQRFYFHLEPILQNLTSQNTQTVKLPTLQPPEFFGDIKDWPAFWSSFKAAVHDQNIPEIQKLVYLFSLVKGRAKAVIAGFALRPENYLLVVQTLESKYGQPELLKATLERELWDLPPAEKARSLEQTVDAIERIMRQLEALNENLENSQIRRRVLEKLPSWMLSEIHVRQTEEGDQSVRKMREIIAQIMRRRQWIISAKGMKTEKSADQKKPHKATVKREESAPLSSALAATDDKGKPVESKEKKVNSKPRCAFCMEEHYSDLCAQFADYFSRREKVKELGLCTRCLRKGHLAKECKSRVKPCFYCKGNHAGALCREKEALKGNRNQGSATHSVQIEKEDTVLTVTRKSYIQD